MKLQDFIIFVLFFLVSCHSGTKKSVHGEALTIIDISKNYPEKEMILQDIADIEYVSLETSDDVLLGNAPYLEYVSDNYIFLFDVMQGEMFIFNRKGEIVTHFNRRGQGGQEYPFNVTNIVFDEKHEEIFVFSVIKVLVYTLKGEYKRSFNLDDLNLIRNASNFNDETLLVYYDYQPPRKNYENPYFLISKKDGSIVSVLDINFPVRYANSIIQTIDVGGQTYSTRLRINVFNNIYYGQDFVISDISSDTIFLLTQNLELAPLLARKPSVHASEPRKVWTAQLMTDKFIILEIKTLDFIAAEEGRPAPPVVTLIHFFETKETFKLSILNAEYSMGKWFPPDGRDAPAIAKNMSANWMQPHRLIEAYKDNQLKGEFEKFVATLDEDDNPIVRILKFK